MAWFIASDDGVETTIRDDSQPVQEDNVVCWGATPVDARRIVTARALTTRVLANLVQRQSSPTEVIALEAALEQARYAEQGQGQDPEAPPEVLALVPTLVETVKVLLGLLDNATCPWCFELSLPGNHRDGCEGYRAWRLVQTLGDL